MKIDKYIERSEDIVLLSESGSVRAIQVLLSACEKKRDALREIIETNPKHSPEELQEDLVFLLGMIKGINWVIGLPARSRDFIKKIERSK